MQDHASRMSSKLREFPELRPYLEAIAKRYGKKGVLSGRQKLADDGRDYLLLSELFGMHALRKNNRHHVVLHYDRLFENIDHDAWVDGLHRVLGMPMKIAPRMGDDAAQQVEKLIKSLRLKHTERTWLAAWLDGIKDRLKSVLRSHGQEDCRDDLRASLALHDFLLEHGEAISIAQLSAQFCGDSKVLRDSRILEYAATALAVSQNHELPRLKAEREQLLSRYGVLFQLMSVRVTFAGPLFYYIDGQRFDWIATHHRHGLTAVLPLETLEKIERWEIGEGVTEVITSENEAPFAKLSKTSSQVCVFTEGFPNRAVMHLLTRLAEQGLRCKHWGDSDLNGLRIAEQVATVMPTQLWRCDLDELKRLKAKLLPLTPEQAARIEAFLRQNPDFRYAEELTYTLENGWLEQESWF